MTKTRDNRKVICPLQTTVNLTVPELDKLMAIRRTSGGPISETVEQLLAWAIREHQGTKGRKAA